MEHACLESDIVLRAKQGQRFFEAAERACIVAHIELDGRHPAQRANLPMNIRQVAPKRQALEIARQRVGIGEAGQLCIGDGLGARVRIVFLLRDVERLQPDIQRPLGIP